MCVEDSYNDNNDGEKDEINDDHRDTTHEHVNWCSHDHVTKSASPTAAILENNDAVIVFNHTNATPLHVLLDDDDYSDDDDDANENNNGNEDVSTISAESKDNEVQHRDIDKQGMCKEKLAICNVMVVHMTMKRTKSMIATCNYVVAAVIIITSV